MECKEAYYCDSFCQLRDQIRHERFCNKTNFSDVKSKTDDDTAIGDQNSINQTKSCGFYPFLHHFEL